ncbi:murein L,D-transpeptidase catalytic domain family protein [Novosphingobium sp. PASSN1]|uniref:murein L,D-transpeptidase catalytic domain family protein n=1 Tax=Novosphingobium sp. PASSN1 TaxID=2015561 RepID=UPI000BD5D817|nr:murein L,D-transpeptidase catalytic domain family protein [Novosphingobium sp. PASSN1]OYU35968.1 MAG: twin-arginine translocation pathway signal protein [Novosphingobium sp. PASSN1]
MTIDRRHLLGALAGTAASLVLPRSGAQAQEAELPGGTFWGTVPVADADAPVLAGGQTTIARSGILPLLPRALAALDRHGAAISVRDRIGIVDFAQPSRAARFHIVDLASGTVSAPLLVAHGKGSDPANRGIAEHFSNQMDSEASSRGSYVTGEVYYGKHGRSRRLIGLDPDNDRALERGIVIHAASYVSPAVVAMQGRVGRSQGCFAVNPREITQVLEALGPGRLLFATA